MQLAHKNMGAVAMVVVTFFWLTVLK